MNKDDARKHQEPLRPIGEVRHRPYRHPSMAEYLPPPPVPPATPLGGADPDDHLSWKRRVLVVPGIDFEGSQTQRRGYMATMPLVVHSDPGEKLRAIGDKLSIECFNQPGCISTSLALELLDRAYVQRPMEKDWVMGNCARWWMSHRRGIPRVNRTDEYLRGEWARLGFMTPEAYEQHMAAVAAQERRKLRERMEVGELRYEDIAPEIPLEWIKSGRLVIPKERKKERVDAY